MGVLTRLWYLKQKAMLRNLFRKPASAILTIFMILIYGVITISLLINPAQVYVMKDLHMAVLCSIGFSALLTFSLLLSKRKALFYETLYAAPSLTFEEIFGDFVDPYINIQRTIHKKTSDALFIFTDNYTVFDVFIHHRVYFYHLGCRIYVYLSILNDMFVWLFYALYVFFKFDRLCICIIHYQSKI